ncbi:MAG: hypothetical protein OP8BY_0068 [Candidatus Saccharicenans subterraneus]|uniref:Uncharacterized protein n=1 Tax=Candidatus Saccharicenans subterraneus TaxID=2508984 RepID=A0A3E2BLS5_9BACT|nr:MAG: hypothetical protein OP8BY_0068 [Candidatus Saccharicenans subterraneum]
MGWKAGRGSGQKFILFGYFSASRREIEPVSSSLTGRAIGVILFDSEMVDNN